MVSPDKVNGKAPEINNPRNDDSNDIINPMKPYNIRFFLLITL